ncbi:hypothetical protein DIM_01850 [Candidatus Denitrolinea symbiosum]|nr:hypothetical protein DIM_01850 [Candidatus Denitrolinea symbiosum]
MGWESTGWLSDSGDGREMNVHRPRLGWRSGAHFVGNLTCLIRAAAGQSLCLGHIIPLRDAHADRDRAAHFMTVSPKTAWTKYN